MRRHRVIAVVLLFAALLLAIPMEVITGSVSAAAKNTKQLIDDSVGVLSKKEVKELNELANRYGSEIGINIIGIVTDKDQGNWEVLQDLYAKNNSNEDFSVSNAAVLILNTNHEKIYINVFQKAADHLDDERLSSITDIVADEYGEGRYKAAFQRYIESVYQYVTAGSQAVDSGKNSTVSSMISSTNDGTTFTSTTTTTSSSTSGTTSSTFTSTTTSTTNGTSFTSSSSGESSNGAMNSSNPSMFKKWSDASNKKGNQLIFDEAKLLTGREYEELQELAKQYSEERKTDMIIYTTNDPLAYDVKRMTQDFYDEYGPGYKMRHGNAIILMVDMTQREIYLAGFYKAKVYFDDDRLDQIRDKIAPYLTDKEYKDGFLTYLKTVHKYMGYRPGVNPDNLLLNIWVQLGAALVIGGGIVTLLVYRSGGRVTVDAQTYEDPNSAGLVDYSDQYIRTCTTRTRRYSSSSSSSSSGGRGSGGGGTTSGGHSHSGSRGSF
ncbi:TPM domain-containing protein [Paenibacillus alvei]|uniref:TPM domain-containing protein n=1 Tax=Paenibacillus alvei TaxID=44250 RepID=UPI000385E17C|nr:TPM domain-containing protein [Paenibacillus alvei]EPY14314.1 hypothetical protein PAAL66ix_03216 [Paenibacillus alvei A6-6i-x]